jgi:hypothetical protein
MKTSAETKGVLSDILVEFAVVLMVSIPGYVLEQEWLRLTITTGACILSIRSAIQLRKKAYDKSE